MYSSFYSCSFLLSFWLGALWCSVSTGSRVMVIGYVRQKTDLVQFLLSACNSKNIHLTLCTACTLRTYIKNVILWTTPNDMHMRKPTEKWFLLLLLLVLLLVVSLFCRFNGMASPSTWKSDINCVYVSTSLIFSGCHLIYEVTIKSMAQT